jgi:hypothetical protein
VEGAQSEPEEENDPDSPKSPKRAWEGLEWVVFGKVGSVADDREWEALGDAALARPLKAEEVPGSAVAFGVSEAGVLRLGALLDEAGIGEDDLPNLAASVDKWGRPVGWLGHISMRGLDRLAEILEAINRLDRSA